MASILHRSIVPAGRAGKRRAGEAALAILLVAVLGVFAPGAASAASFRAAARSAGAVDLATGAWLFEQAVDDTFPIASLTKLAAALTFVESVEDLDAKITILSSDWVHAGRTRLRVGDRVSGRTLLRLALVSSDNCAARAFTHPLGLDWESYALKMTLTARRLGCRSTVFVEPTGKDARNVSTVRDVAILFRAALQDPLLRDALGTSEFVLETARGPRPIGHSSMTVRYRDDVFAAKTGYTDAAGYCLAQAVRDPGGDFITVVLGTTSKRRRSGESIRILEHVRALRGQGS